MMMTVNEVSKLAGVSIRTLQYYGQRLVFTSDGYTHKGVLSRLHRRCRFGTPSTYFAVSRELEFPLKRH